MQFCSARHLEIKQWLRCQDTNEVYLICRWSVNIYSKHGDKNVTAKPNYSGSAFVTQINEVDIEDLKSFIFSTRCYVHTLHSGQQIDSHPSVAIVYRFHCIFFIFLAGKDIGN